MNPIDSLKYIVFALSEYETIDMMYAVVMIAIGLANIGMLLLIRKQLDNSRLSNYIKGLCHLNALFGVIFGLIIIGLGAVPWKSIFIFKALFYLLGLLQFIQSLTFIVYIFKAHKSQPK